MGVIVCCVDESPVSRDAARVAARLAAEFGLELVLLHVGPSPTAPGTSAVPGGHARLAHDEREAGDRLLAEIAREAGLPDSVERRVELGDTAHTILAVCDELKAAFVVLGSRGRGKIASAMLGSVSTAVAAKATIPVVIVPHGSAAERGA